MNRGLAKSLLFLGALLLVLNILFTTSFTDIGFILRITANLLLVLAMIQVLYFNKQR